MIVVDDCRKIPAGTVAKASCLVGVFTIGLCYGLALYFHHVPAWLPMISDCAVYAPEKYPFRIGMIVSACLIFVNASLLVFYISNRSAKNVMGSLAARSTTSTADKVGLVLAGLSSTGLAIVGAVNEREDMAVHGTAAVVFFFAFEAFMIQSTIRLSKLPNVPPKGVAIKKLISIVVAILLSLYVYFSSHVSKWHIQIAMCEWSGVLLILLFNLSCLVEFQNEYVAELTLQQPSSSSPSSNYQPVPLLSHETALPPHNMVNWVPMNPYMYNYPTNV